MAITYDQMVNYLNYAVIGILAIGAIFGFFKGLFKSVYNFVVFVGLLLVGWFLSPIIINFLLNFDLTEYKLSLQEINITTLDSFIHELIIKYQSSLEPVLVEGTLASELFDAVVFMGLRIVVLIVWLILMGTVFKFIFWLIYLIIKPRKTKNGVKRKVSLLSRFGGMGVGLVHTLIIVLLFSIPFAGLTSIGSSLSSVLDELNQDDADNQIQLVYTANGINVLPENEFLGEAIKLMENYRETYMGKIGGIKFGEYGFDEIIFDEIFSFKVNNTQVMLRRELSIASKAYLKIMTELDGKELNIVNIAALDKEVLEDIVEDLAKLKLIHVAIPVGLEVVVNTDILDEKLGDISTLVDLEELLDALINVDYEAEIEYLGKAFVVALDLINDLGLLNNDEEGKEINYFSLDPEKVKEVTSNLSESKLLRILSDVALSFLVNTDTFKNLLENVNKTPEDLNLTNVNFADEIKVLGEIYAALINIGFTSTKLEDLKFEEVTDQALNDLGSAVYSSKLFSQNTTLLAGILIDMIPDEYKEIIVINSFNQNDFVSVMSLMVVLAKSGILSSDDFDPINLLTKENIEKIADYISKSDLLSSNVEGLLNILLQQMSLPIQIEFPDDLTWKGEEGKAELIALFTTAEKIVNMMDEEGNFVFTKESIDQLAETIVESRILMGNINNLITYIFENTELTENFTIVIPEDIVWDTEEGKDEFKALLTAVGIILDSGMIEDQDASKLTDKIIEDLAEAMSSSRIIRENLSSLINSVIPEDLDLELDIDPEEWTYDEINTLLRTARAFARFSERADLNVITELTNEEIDYLVNSRIIVRYVVKMLEEMTAPGGTLHDLLFLPKGEVEYFGSNGELKKFILAARIIVSESLQEGQGIEDLENITYGSISGSNMHTVLASKILTETIISHIEKIAVENDVISIPPDFDRSNVNYVEGTWETELSNLIDAIGIFVDKESYINDLDLDPNTILSLTDKDIETITRSRFISYSIVLYIQDENEKEDSFISLPDELNQNHPDYNDDLWYGEDGELAKMFKALRALGLTDLSGDINFNVIFTEAKGDPKNEVILASRVVETTIINKIITESEPGGALDGMLIIPGDIEWGIKYDEEGNIVDRGELRKLIIAIDILLGEDLEDKNFEDVEFNIENIFNSEEDPTRQDRLLASRIVEESIINRIEIEIEAGGALHGKLVPPSDLNRNHVDYNRQKWYGENGELRRFLAAIEILLDGKSFEEAEFDVEKFFDDASRETLLASRLVEASVVNFIETEMDEGGSLHEKLYKPSGFVESDWYGEDGELRRFLDAIEVLLNGKSFEEAEFDIEKFFDDTTKPILLRSRLIEASVVKTIEKEMDTGGSLHGKLVAPSYLDINKPDYNESLWYGENGELTRFLDAIEILLDGESFENAEFRVEKFFDDASREILLKSKLVEESVIKFIEDEMDTGGSLNGKLIAPSYLDRNHVDYDKQKWYGEDGELVNFLNAIEILLDGESFENAEFRVEKFFDDASREILLKSKLVEESVIKFIEDEMSPSGSLYGKLVKPIGFTHDDWYGEEGELRKFFAAIEVLLEGESFENAEFRVEKFFEEDSKDILLASRLIEASVVNTIQNEMASGGSLHGTLVAPDELNKEHHLYNENLWYGETGELRYFLAAIEIILGGDSFENAEFRVEKFFDNESQDVLLASRLVEASVVNHIEKEMTTGGALHGKLVKPVGFDNEEWYGEDGELRRFLAAIEILLGGDSFENAEFKVEKFFDDASQNTLLASRLVEASVVNTIQNEMALTTSPLYGKLVAPNDLNKTHPSYNENLWYGTNGELRRFLTSIELLVGSNGNFTDAQFDVDTILGGNQATILESRVVEASVIKSIKEASNLVIPSSDNPTYYYFDGSYQELVWERTFDVNGNVVDVGELRRFLSGVSALLGVNSFAAFSFTMNEMLYADFSNVLASRVLEATIAKSVNDLLVPGGALYGFIVEPSEHYGYQWYYHAASTNPVRNGTYVGLLASPQYTDLLGLIIALQKMDAAGVNFNVIGFESFRNAPSSEALASALWDYSRVIQGSIVPMLNKIIEGHVNPDFFQFGENTGALYEMPINSKQDLINGIYYIKSL